MEIAIGQRASCDVSSVKKGFHSGKSFVANKDAETLLYSIESGKRRLVCSCSYIAATLNIRPDLGLTKVEDGRRIEVVAGAVQEIDHFSPAALAMDHMYEFLLWSGRSQ